MPRRGMANPEHPQPAVHQGIPDPLGRGLAGGARLPPELGPELLDLLADRLLVPGVILVVLFSAGASGTACWIPRSRGYPP
jgi:hypothetical protein